MRANRGGDQRVAEAHRESVRVALDETERYVQARIGRNHPAETTHPHLDYGYAVTSHSSQGQTADRVLVHVDTDGAVAPLVNRRMAYVAISRGRFDAQIYTNDQSQLGDALSRDASHRSAIELGRGPVTPGQAQEPSASTQEAHWTISR